MDHHVQLFELGYSFIPGVHYQSAFAHRGFGADAFRAHLAHLREGYLDLRLDPYSPGSRLRSYAQCRLDDGGAMAFGHFTPYQQTKAYNPDTGGVVREYPLIQRPVLDNPLFLALLASDVSFVERYAAIGHPRDTTIGIHLFRYRATPDAPAFSSPLWLHRDDEDVVFVHLVHRSPNAIGGDSLIAADGRHVERVIRLDEAFDTLVVNHRKLHAVTPVGCLDRPAGPGYSTRDIILVTFQKGGDA